MAFIYILERDDDELLAMLMLVDVDFRKRVLVDGLFEKLTGQHQLSDHEMMKIVSQSA